MSSESKKPKYYHKPKGKGRNVLSAGQRGFLATCNFHEKDCIRECYNILNHYADELYGVVKITQENTTETAIDDNIDIADELENEIAALKATNNKNQTNNIPKRFQNSTTGTPNCLFIRTTLENPEELGYHIVKDIAETRQQRSRFLLRLLPVEIVCRANVKDIIDNAGILFDKHFLKQGYKYAIVFNRRYNNDIKRDTIITELASLMQTKNNANCVELKKPEKVVIVEIIKGHCCLSVVTDYYLYKKYNLIELANVNNTESTTLHEGNEKVDDDNQKVDEGNKVEENATVNSVAV